jgi:preprotein translocase subunit YajC
MWYLAEGEPAAAAAAPSNIFFQLWPVALMFVVLYFLLIRPQQKRQKTRSGMLNTLKKGDKVVTIGGLHGSILEINEDTVILRVNEQTKMTFDRSAVNSIAKTSTEEKN